MIEYIEKRRKLIKWRRKKGTKVWHRDICGSYPGHDYEELILPKGLLPSVGEVDAECKAKT